MCWAMSRVYANEHQKEKDTIFKHCLEQHRGSHWHSSKRYKIQVIGRVRVEAYIWPLQEINTLIFANTSASSLLCYDSVRFVSDLTGFVLEEIDCKPVDWPSIWIVSQERNILRNLLKSVRGDHLGVWRTNIFFKPEQNHFILVTVGLRYIELRDHSLLHTCLGDTFSWNLDNEEIIP